MKHGRAALSISRFAFVAALLFKLLLLPEGTVREVSYAGGRVQASF